MNKEKLIMVPYPKKLNFYIEYFQIGNGDYILIPSVNAEQLFPVASRLREILKNKNSLELPILIGKTTPGGRAIIFDNNLCLSNEGYILEVKPHGIKIEYCSATGAFHAVSTLKQIILQCVKTIPCLKIEDEPDFKTRGIMLDISRNKIPTMDTLFRFIDFMADLKLNQLQLYIEGFSFAYPAYPSVWKNNTPVTGEEIIELDKYCKERFIELVPNQNSFGHMSAWLARGEFRNLAECPDGYIAPSGNFENAGTLNPVDPESIELIKNQYDDLLPCFTSEIFNIGCDETFELGEGKSREECEKLGTGRVYLDYLLKVYGLVKECRKKMMFWGDIIIKYPDLIDELPKDVIALEWGYEANHPFNEDGEKFKKAGIPFYVCPGTSSWNSMAGRTDNMKENLLNAAINGKKHGAAGFLNTDWGDNGHWQYLPFSYAGFAYGAGLSWDVDQNRSMDMGTYLDEFIFLDKSKTIGQSILDLGNYYLNESHHHHNNTTIALILYSDLNDMKVVENTDETFFDRTISYVESFYDRFNKAEMQCEDLLLVDTELRNTLRFILHGAKLGKLKLFMKTGCNKETRMAMLREMVGDIAAIIKKHKELWQMRNRPGGLEDSVAKLKNLKNGYIEALNDIKKPGYHEPNHSVEKRVADLLSRMTLEEKIREMNMLGSVGSIIKDGGFSPELAQQFFKGMGIGAVQDPRLDPEDTAEVINELQRFLKENTRLGIPAFVIAETLHGVMSPGMTIFPQAIALASTWNTKLIKEIASVIAKEARSIGISQSLAPDIDLAREPRWGRVEETYGEDPYLCARFGVEYIKGLQGEGQIIDSDHIVATIKHFAAHGSPEGGINLSPVQAGERQLRELYLPPFKAGIVEAGALCVMPAYSEFDGIPCSSSKMLLSRILREEWGFKGYTISDYCAIDMLIHIHRTAESYEQAAKQTVEAGMDMEAPNINVFGEGLKRLVKNGQLPEEFIDRAVSRILKVKISVGLFESPYADKKKIKSTVNCDTHRKLALKAAQESIVLLKNKDNLLPLDKNIKSIAVVGPNADVAQLGDYCLEKKDAISPLQGIMNRVAPKTRVSYAKGCGIYELSKDMFDEAIEAARNSKAAIIAIGGSSIIDYGMGWGQDSGKIKTCGEGFDVTDLGLPGVQQELVEAVVNTGTPTIVVLIDGRPSSIPWIAENASAVIEAWYAGEEGGNVLADIIFGNVNPSGRLTVSFPKSVGQTPVYYNCKPSARGFYKMPGSPEKPGRDYVFTDTKPLYEFGFGLSYTEFEYSNLVIRHEKIRCDGKVTVSVKVKNIGKHEGKEVVRLYLNDVISSVTTPVKALKGFKKINLKPGKEKKITFELGFEDLSLVNEHMMTVVEPGEFEVMVGNLSSRFEVEKDSKVYQMQ